MKIIICGATGFIGSNLLKHFDNGKNEIFAVYNNRPPIKKSSKNINWFKADLRLPDSILPIIKNTDLFLQFAATTSGSKDITSKPYIHVTDNAVINSYLLRACFENKVGHFIFPSCTIMYQKSDKALKTTDFNPSDTIQPHYFGTGHTKVYLENMCDFYSREGKTKFTAFRHSNVYGPYDKYDLDKSHVFAASVLKVMNSTDGKVNVWGTGEEKRDLLYVGDLVDFIAQAIEKQTTPYELFNVGLGKGTKIKDLVTKMISHSGKNLEIVHDLSKPTIPTSLFLDCTKAKKLIGWEPQHTLDEGIIKTLEWYKTNIK